MQCLILYSFFVLATSQRKEILLIVSIIFILTINTVSAESYSYDSAEYLYTTHQYSKCLEYFEKYYKKSGGSYEENVRAQLLIFKTSIANHEFTKLSKQIDEYLGNAPLRVDDKYRFLLLKSEFHLKQSDVTNAKKAFFMADSLYKAEGFQQTAIENATFLYLKAKLNLVDSKEETINLLLKSLSLVPKENKFFVEILRSLGVKMIVNSKLDSGLYYLEQGISHNLRFQKKDSIGLIKLYLQKANALFRKRNIKESIKMYEELLRPLIFNPHSVNENSYYFLELEFYRLSIILYRYIHDYERTIEYGSEFLTKAPAFYPNNSFRYGEVYRDIANSYLKLGQLDLFVKYIDKSVALLVSKEEYQSYVFF